MNAVLQSLPVVPMRNAVLFPGRHVPDLGGPRRDPARDRGRAEHARSASSSPWPSGTTSEAVTPTSSTRSARSRRSARSSGASAASACSSRASRAASPLRFVSEGRATSRRRSRRRSEMLPLDPRDPAFVGLHREARERAAELGKKLGLPDEVVEQILAEVDEPGRLADLVAGYLDIPVAGQAGAARDAVGRGPAAPRAGPRPAPDRRARRAGGHPVQGPGGARRAASARCSCASS